MNTDQVEKEKEVIKERLLFLERIESQVGFDYERYLEKKRLSIIETAFSNRIKESTYEKEKEVD